MLSIGIDIGGTFTDCVVIDDSGAVVGTAKSPTTSAALEDGVLAALELAAAQIGRSVHTMLSDTRALIHGSTVATNAIVQRQGARTGLITTAGHEDTLVIGKAIQKSAGLSERELTNQAGLRKPEPLVGRRHVKGAVERVDRDGDVVVPLDPHHAAQLVDALVADGVESLAICLLWAFRNPIHEQRIRDICRSDHPDLHVLASHEIAPLMGEYERMATTVLSAYVAPAVTSYLGRLEERLAACGHGGQLLIAHAAGGVATVDGVARRPLQTLDSGPASGVVGARFLARTVGQPNLICADMGGTTFDVSAVHGGDYIFDDAPVIAQYHYLLPKIGVRSIGAGGGSVVWADPDGVVKVGPRSAGATPGPACYGVGTEPTVTDVNMVLGFLDPDGGLGGRAKLDRQRSLEALSTVNSALGSDPAEIARAAFTIVNAQMADLISRLTIERGHDPRDFTLLAYGGAGGCHVAYLARELGLDRIWMSPHASVFSALGMLCGEIVHSEERECNAMLPLSEPDRIRLLETIEAMTAAIESLLGADPDTVLVDHRPAAHVKYAMQPRSLPVPLDGWRPDRDPEGHGLVRAFEAAYAELYGAGTGYPQAGFEIVKCAASASIRDLERPLPTMVTTQGSTPEASRRPVLFPDLGTVVDCPVISGGLPAGEVLAGPAIIERAGDTIVLPSFASAEMNHSGNIVITVRSA